MVSFNRGTNALLISAIVSLSLFILYLNHHRISSSFEWANFSKKHPKFAYATFLSSHLDSENSIARDPYVIATRVLNHQLLHHPHTRTRQGIPLLVLVPPHVPPQIQELLASEGATVVPVDYLLPQSWKPHPTSSRWIDQFTKLRLFELTQYDRILYMDNDMLVTRCLDDIFSEKEVATQYSIAGTSDQEGPEGERPKPITSESRLNGGFFVLKPDAQLFQYYRSVLEFGQEERFEASMMEMGLLNYAHRFEGNMPWAPLEPGKWSSNWPSFRDYERGSATLHDKFWEEGNRDWIDRRLVEMWWRIQGQMEGFWMFKGKLL
ncbi:nucleotide-diphospho-sugar transferase [Mycena rebaudengoi]|nr:nucleotide-diphospho-sugar transferase [Mycena rebaudengoi]